MYLFNPPTIIDSPQWQSSIDVGPGSKKKRTPARVTAYMYLGYPEEKKNHFIDWNGFPARWLLYAIVMSG